MKLFIYLKLIFDPNFPVKPNAVKLNEESPWSAQAFQEAMDS